MEPEYTDYEEYLYQLEQDHEREIEDRQIRENE